jgi:hypothetical protein
LAVELWEQEPSETFESWVIQSRLKQGLPAHVEGLATLLRVAELLGLCEDTDDHKQDGQQ